MISGASVGEVLFGFSVKEKIGNKNVAFNLAGKKYSNVGTYEDEDGDATTTFADAVVVTNELKADYLKNYTDYMDGRDDVLEMQSFIREILEQRKYEPSKRHYSESTLNHILFEMDVKNCPTEEKLEF